MSLNLWFLRPSSFEVGKFYCCPPACCAQEPRQNYNTGAMAHKIPNQIHWLTRFVRLNPGDIIATGTFHEGLMPVSGPARRVQA